MIEILNKSDIEKIKNVKLKKYVCKSFDRLPNTYNYPADGYFIVIESLEEIKSDFINLSIGILNGFDTGLYSDINMVEIEEGVVEILVFIDNDVNVSFLMLESILDEFCIEELKSYII